MAPKKKTYPNFCFDFLVRVPLEQRSPPYPERRRTFGISETFCRIFFTVLIHPCFEKWAVLHFSRSALPLYSAFSPFCCPFHNIELRVKLMYPTFVSSLSETSFVNSSKQRLTLPYPYPNTATIDKAIYVFPAGLLRKGNRIINPRDSLTWTEELSLS